MKFCALRPQLFALLFAISLSRVAAGQEIANGIFHLKPQRPVAELRSEALRATPPQEAGEFRTPELVELVKIDPSIRLDIRYARSDNFLSTPMYSQARAFMQRPAAEALARVNQKLHAEGYGLLIHDAYRPWYVTKMFWDATPDDKKIFVADPAVGSRHNRGCAVDLSMYQLSTGKEVSMPSVYDEMTPRAFADYPGGTAEERRHRAILREAMHSERFEVYPQEWWHFDYKDWKQYPIMNLRFEELGDNSRSAAERWRVGVARTHGTVAPAANFPLSK
jgi:D-alanyl-D-alanine dipeptidase